MKTAAKKVVDTFVDISYVDKENKHTHNLDHVYEYACEVMQLGLLFEFKDAIREGDGHRIIRCWRYFLLIFKHTNRTNYSIEAFHLLAHSAFIPFFSKNGYTAYVEQNSQHSWTTREKYTM